MTLLDELLTYYDVSDERVELLIRANPGLTASEIAEKEGLEPLEYVSPESYGADKNEDRF
jgi:hypothetical protein